MSRTKQAHKGTVDGVGGLIWVRPVLDTTELPEPKFHGHQRTIPAISATGPDGREWYVTLESRFGNGTSRELYIRRMRALAATLAAEADRMEQDPTR